MGVRMGVITASLLRAMRSSMHFQTVPIIVELAEGSNVAGVAAQVNSLTGIEIRQVLPMSNAFSVIAPTDIVDRLAGLNYVKTIHLDQPMYAFQDPPLPPDPLGLLGSTQNQIEQIMADPRIFITPGEGWIGTAEAIKAIGVPELHSRNIKGQGVSVWVLDTGVDPTTPQLQGVVSGMHSTTLGTPMDGNGHGTFCACEIAGQYYVEPVLKIPMLGVAPECELHTVKVLTDLGMGNTSDILKGMELALSNNASVISLSLGGDGSAEEEETDLMVTLINKSAETHPKTIFVIAAGNSGSEGETAGSTVGVPAVAEECVAVGATSLIDSGKRAHYSSTGPTLQAKRIKPDICAPGGGLAYTKGRMKGLGDLYAGTAFGSQLDPNDGLLNSATSLKGTSMATPLVAGCCALFKQITSELTARDIKKMFEKYGARKTNELGHGQIDARWILQALGQM